MLCAKFGLNWPSGSEEILESYEYIFTTSLLSPLGKRRSPPFGLTWISLSLWHECFVPSLEWNWPSGVSEDFKSRQCILLCRYYLPLENSVTLHLNKLEFILPKNALCPVWLIELGLCMTTDNGQISIRKTSWTWAFGLGKLYFLSKRPTEIKYMSSFLRLCMYIKSCSFSF